MASVMPSSVVASVADTASQELTPLSQGAPTANVTSLPSRSASSCPVCSSGCPSKDTSRTRLRTCTGKAAITTARARRNVGRHQYQLRPFTLGRESKRSRSGGNRGRTRRPDGQSGRDGLHDIPGDRLPAQPLHSGSPGRHRQVTAHAPG
ncbi:hypothetical protein ACFQ51_53540 [Streptomyces kaempferi]